MNNLFLERNNIGFLLLFFFLENHAMGEYRSKIEKNQIFVSIF